MQNHAQTEIKTERLLLRTITEADATIVRKLDLTKGDYETEADAIEWIRWVKQKNEEGRIIIVFYIWETVSDQCIGRVYIHCKPELNDEVEIAYGINEEYRNKGYATEAAQAVTQFYFEKSMQNVLVAIVKPENVASRRVVEKIGFENCGTRIVPDENGEDCEFEYFKLSR